VTEERAADAPDLAADLIAGVAVAGLLLPEAVAYACIAGLPPAAGIVGLLAGLACYGLLGTSRFALVSPTSSSAAVALAATVSFGQPDGLTHATMIASLAVVAGLLLSIGGLARAGAMAHFIARPVLRGFAIGLALVIVVRQLPVVLGIHAVESNVLRLAVEIGARISEWHWPGAWIAIASLALMRLTARWHRLPGALLVLVGGIAFDLLGFSAQYGVPAVGAIRFAAEPPGLPALALDQWLRAGELAGALALILFAESYGSIRTFALERGDAINPDRDLLGLGLANLVAGLCHGMPVGAGFSATSAGVAAGATSRRAAWAAWGVVALAVAALLPAIAHTPEPCLAAIVIHAVLHTLRLDGVRAIFQWERERIIFVAAFVGVLLLGVLHGLLAATGVSLVLLLRSLAQPRVSILGRLGETHDFVDVGRHPTAVIPPAVLVVRPESPLFFANADRMMQTVRSEFAARPGTRALVLSLEESPDLDVSSLEALRDFAVSMKRHGTRLLLARVKDAVRDVLERAALPELPTTSYAAWSVDDAVQDALRGLQA